MWQNIRVILVLETEDKELPWVWSQPGIHSETKYKYICNCCLYIIKECVALIYILHRHYTNTHKYGHATFKTWMADKLPFSKLNLQFSIYRSQNMRTRWNTAFFLHTQLISQSCLRLQENGLMKGQPPQWQSRASDETSCFVDFISASLESFLISVTFQVLSIFSTPEWRTERWSYPAVFLLVFYHSAQRTCPWLSQTWCAVDAEVLTELTHLTPVHSCVAIWHHFPTCRYPFWNWEIHLDLLVPYHYLLNLQSTIPMAKEACGLPLLWGTWYPCLPLWYCCPLT